MTNQHALQTSLKPPHTDTARYPLTNLQRQASASWPLSLLQLLPWLPLLLLPRSQLLALLLCPQQSRVLLPSLLLLQPCWLTPQAAASPCSGHEYSRAEDVQ